MAKTTCDINELKQNGFLFFTWGRIVEHYSFKEYDIVKYISKDDLTKKESISYHAWISGKDTSRGSATFDGMLAVILAYKYEGCNHHAETYIQNMLKMPAIEPEQELIDAHG